MSLNLDILIDSILMQHYDRRGQYDMALSKIDEAMEHTPTVIDLYSAKVGYPLKLLLFILYSNCTCICF